MRRGLPRAIADTARDIRTPFARALARDRAEFGRKDVRTASPRAGYSEKTFKRNAGTAFRHAAQLPRAGAHPRRIDHSADETFARPRFMRSPPEIRKKTRVAYDAPFAHPFDRTPPKCHWLSPSKNTRSSGKPDASGDFVRATMTMPRDRGPCGRLAIRMDRLRGV
ncbi:hypothetical protein [Burkholderia ubonensis]|uniref:hypothetical protein n=1 Tax=Burkholderia ubonensis TaxID=101571 RepID=UPI000B243D97|nr:hypothetical protein [Burkholderia ubonensis]